jgi:hypothetical protein
MHADFQKLLALRDADPVDAVVGQHVASCTQCSLELARLKRLKNELRQLSAFDAPAGAWTAIRERLKNPPLERRVIPWQWVTAAAVAGWALGIAALVHLSHRPLINDTTSASNQVRASSGSDPVQALVSRSQHLETVLRTLPPRPTVERATTSATIDELQAGIQMLDQQLSAAIRDNQEQTQRLWSARVDLMDSLVYVRYAEASRNADKSDNPSMIGAI